MSDTLHEMPEEGFLPEGQREAHQPDGPESPTSLRTRTVAALVFSQFGFSLPAVSMTLVSWPYTIGALAPDEKASYLSLLTGLYALVNMLVTPIAGVLSDHCTARWGMRRPFLLAGSVLGVISMALMGLASGMVTLIIGSMIYGVAASIYAGANAPLVPDQVPESRRGSVLGMVQIAVIGSGLLVSIVMPMFLGQQFILFAVPGLFFGVAGLITVLLIDDRRLDIVEARERLSLRGFFSQFLVDPRTVPDYSWAWLGKSIVTLGTVLTTVYGMYFLTDQLKVSDADLPGVVSLTGVLGLATAFLGAAVGSWVADRFRMRKRMVIIATVLICVGAIIAGFSPSVAVYLVGLVVMGIGSGVWMPVGMAVLVDVLPGGGRESGKYMGLVTLADQLPRTVGPFLAAGVVAAAPLLPIAAYPAVFLAGGVLALAGGLLTLKVKGSV